MKDRRITESKIFKESHLFVNNVSQKRYLLCREWFNEWMSFLYKESDAQPRSIDNSELANRIINEGYQNLRKNIDYFEFPAQTWKALYSVYRGGPAILININGRIEIEPEMKALPSADSNKSAALKHVNVLNQFLVCNTSSDQGRDDYDFESNHKGGGLGLSRVMQITTNSGSIRPQDLQQITMMSQQPRKTKYVISSTLHDETFDTDNSMMPGVGPLALHQRVNSDLFNP